MKIYEGIIEDDNVEYGVVKARLFGLHTNDRNILPTSDLQNFKILYPAESNIDEISYFRTIANGSWITAVFLDDDQQYGLVLGSIVKTVDKLPDFDNGFSDPNGEYPSKLGTTISSEAVTNYPYNRVLKTKKHIIEIDDSEGAERINILHDSGAKIEFQADGNINISGTDNINLNGDTDSAIAFTEMQTAFNLLRTQVNTHITAFTAHVHPDPITGNTGTPTVSGILTTADMSDAEVPTVKLP